MFRKLACGLAIGLLGTISNAHAEIVMDLYGTNGSNLISFQVSGSVVLTQDVTAVNTATALLPDPSAGLSSGWAGEFDFRMGDFILPHLVSSTENYNLMLSSDIVMSATGVGDFGVIRSIGIDGSNTAGRDSLRLDLDNFTNYPALSAGDTVTWTGSGSFTLAEGNFEDVLIQGLGYAAKPELFVLNIQEATSVPLPAPLLLLGLGLVGIKRSRSATR